MLHEFKKLIDRKFKKQQIFTMVAANQVGMNVAGFLAKVSGLPSEYFSLDGVVAFEKVSDEVSFMTVARQAQVDIFMKARLFGCAFSFLKPRKVGTLVVQNDLENKVFSTRFLSAPLFNDESTGLCSLENSGPIKIFPFLPFDHPTTIYSVAYAGRPFDYKAVKCFCAHNNKALYDKIAKACAPSATDARSRQKAVRAAVSSLKV